MAMRLAALLVLAVLAAAIALRLSQRDLPLSPLQSNRARPSYPLRASELSHPRRYFVPK
jgi:hypothetical protein